MISKIKYEYLLLFIAIAWAAFFSFVLQLQPYFSTSGDDVSYLHAARLLYFDSRPSNTRPLLIAAIFGFPYLFGAAASIILKWVYLINFLSWFFTVILVFRIAAFRFGRKKAFILAVLFLLCIGNLAHAFRFLSESVFIFLLTLSVYFIHRHYAKNKPEYLTIAIALLLFNALIKPVALGLCILVVLFFARRLKSIVWNRFAVLLMLGCGLVFFQMYAMKKTYGDFTLSYIGPVTYYNYLGAKADCYKKGIVYLPSKTERTLQFNTLDVSTQKKVAARDFADQLRNNSSNLFRAYLFCIYSNSSKGDYIISECKNVDRTFYFDFFRFCFKAISKLQNILFTIAGVSLSLYFLLAFKRQKGFYVLLSLILLYIFFISAVSCYECDRFHIAFFPLVLLLLAELYQKRRSV